jgi:hypothetical protein
LLGLLTCPLRGANAKENEGRSNHLLYPNFVYSDLV